MQNYIEVNVVRDVSSTKEQKTAIRISAIVSISKKYPNLTELQLSNGNILLVKGPYVELSRFLRTNCKDEFIRLKISARYYGCKNKTVWFRRSMILGVAEHTTYRLIETTVQPVIAVEDSYEDIILAIS